MMNDTNKPKNNVTNWQISFQTKITILEFLVGGWTNPFEKYARQNGFIFPK